MPERLVYHWKHGWIPLTHAAALSKAKGNAKLADKYVRGTSSHHADRATAGKSARELHSRLEDHARIAARPGSYRGEPGHHITGTDTHGRRVAVFVPGDRHAAQQAIDNIHGGRSPFHVEHPELAPSGTAAGATRGSAESIARRESIRRAKANDAAGRTSLGAGDSRPVTPSADTGKAAEHARRAAELRAQAEAKRAEAERIAGNVGGPDRAAGRLSAPGLAQAHRNTDSSLRRYMEANNTAAALDHKAGLAEARATEAARQHFTKEELAGARLVHDGFGWHEVVRINAKTVTVKTPYSWTDTIPHGKIHATAHPIPGQPGKVRFRRPGQAAA